MTPEPASSPKAAIWAKASYYSRLDGAVQIEPAHLLAALFERRDVRDVFDRAGTFKPSTEPFMLTRGNPVIVGMVQQAHAALHDDQPVSDLLQFVGVSDRLTNKLVREQIITNVRAQIQEDADGNLAFRGDVPFTNVLRGLGTNATILSRVRESNTPVEAFQRFLARIEQDMLPPHHVPVLPGAFDFPSDNEISESLLPVKRAVDATPVARGTDKFYALDLLTEMLASEDPEIRKQTTLLAMGLMFPSFDVGQCRELVQKFVDNWKFEETKAELKRQGKMTDAFGNEVKIYKKKDYKKDSFLKLYGRDFTALAADNKLSAALGRDKEIDQVITVLGKKKKNNPVLIGETGVGKTAVVEELARRIVRNEVPELGGLSIIGLDLGAMVAGSPYRGIFEAKLEGFIKEAQESGDIVFLDELHTLVGAGSGEGSLDAANILKPALSRGEIRAIGATTLAEFRKIEKDAALERRFDVVKVPAFSDAFTRNDILPGAIAEYEEHHKVKFPEEVRDKLVSWSTRYIKGTNNQPDLSISLTDEVGSYVHRMTSRPPDADGYRHATTDDVAVMIERRTNVPVSEIKENDVESPDTLFAAVTEDVKHQDEAVREISDAIGAKRAGFLDPSKPLTFLALGESGAGKTLTMKTVAKKLGMDFLRIDMTDYQEKYSVNKLAGSPTGYVGYEEGGELTEFVKNHKRTFVMLDEWDKAHENVYKRFLGVWDDGKMTDNKGRIINFEDCIFGCTSNLEVKSLAKKPLGFTSGQAKNVDEEEKQFDVTLLDEIQGAPNNRMPKEVINRFTAILMFNSIKDINLSPEVPRVIDRDSRDLEGMKNLAVRLGDGVAAHIANAAGSKGKYGLRPLNRIVYRRIEQKLSDAAWKKQFDPKVPTIVDIELTPDKKRLTFKFTTAAAEQERLGPTAQFNFKAGVISSSSPNKDAANDSQPGTVDQTRNIGFEPVAV